MNPAIAPARGYLFVPTTSSSGSLILNPESPAQHTLGGEIFYTSASTPPRSILEWKVETGIRLVDDPESPAASQPVPPEEFHSCSLFGGIMGTSSYRMQTGQQRSIGHSYLVPRYIIDNLLQRLSGLGVTYVNNIMLGGYRLQGFSESLFDSLPKIQYIMKTGDDEERQVNFMFVDPRQYIGRDVNGNYILKLKFLIDMIGRSTCLINHTMLQKLVVHLDPANHRVGFGEPIAEL